VAVKLLRIGEDGLGDQLQREAELVARLSHPNLVTLHDVGLAAQGPYLVLELLKGRTLQQRLDEGPLPVAEAVHIAVEVARGLSYAHGEGVVHRDLKPSNVFLTTRGAAKLLDFGMAHAFGRRRVSGGTPAYMAPEQWEENPEDERTDVFALGVMLHRMLTGEYPYGEQGGKWSSGPSEPAALEVQGAPELGELVRRCLQRVPRSRPRDGSAVLAELESIEAALPVTVTETGPSVRSRRRAPVASTRFGRSRLLLLALAAVAVLASLGGTAWYLRGGPGGGRASLSPSIAVLPFADLSPGHDQEYFADGMAEEILNALAHVQGLRVPGRTSSFWFKGKNAELAEIGRKLDVTHVLEGSVRRAGKRLRVTAQVVNVADGGHLWSETFDRSEDDVFAVQDEVARAVVAALQVRLLPGARPATGLVRTSSLEAYDQYLLGRQLRAMGLPSTMPAARDAFQRAVTLDPGFAAAWAGLAYAWGEMGGYVADGPEDVIRAAKFQLEAAERSLALAPDQPDGFVARADYRIGYAWDWLGALADVDRAIALGRADLQAYTVRARVLGGLGRSTEALASARRATEADPLARSAWPNLAAALVETGDFAGAERAARKGLEIAPGNGNTSYLLALALLLQGRSAEALEEFGRNPFEWWRLEGQALVHHQLGRDREAGQALESLKARFGGIAAYQVAEVHAWLGDRDAAFKWLEQARIQHDGGLEAVRADPLLRSLVEDTRWKPFLKKLNMPLD
jgi:serine/threonine-protein kinase